MRRMEEAARISDPPVGDVRNAPHYPDCCFTLHAGQCPESANILGALVKPQPVPPASGIAKHPHRHNGGEGLGGIIPDVLSEREPLVKVETQVAPELLGSERGLACVGGKAEIDGPVRTRAGPLLQQQQGSSG
ncbi:hypothetical protein NMY22_g10628 [Coprinellus aureogranulatus]|nr:hypothetical protein NMY22_g10628 [Coprinellus aureogranulatus]